MVMLLRTCMYYMYKRVLLGKPKKKSLKDKLQGKGMNKLRKSLPLKRQLRAHAYIYTPCILNRKSFLSPSLSQKFCYLSILKYSVSASYSIYRSAI